MPLEHRDHIRRLQVHHVFVVGSISVVTQQLSVMDTWLPCGGQLRCLSGRMQVGIDLEPLGFGYDDLDIIIIGLICNQSQS